MGFNLNFFKILVGVFVILIGIRLARCSVLEPFVVVLSADCRVCGDNDLVDGNADALELPAASALRKALKEVDRALFVPDSHRRLAYRNRPAPIAFDAEGDSSTTTSSPNVCALVVHQLAVEPGNRVLVCGVKAGFTAALCAHIVGPKGRVICLETNPLVVEHARASIKRAGFERRVEVRLVKDVTVGLPDQEPWDAVVVNGAIAWRHGAHTGARSGQVITRREPVAA